MYLVIVCVSDIYKSCSSFCSAEYESFYCWGYVMYFVFVAFRACEHIECLKIFAILLTQTSMWELVLHVLTDFMLFFALVPFLIL